MRLHDTRQDRIVPFAPEGPVVRMYTCGITPYDATHVGHAATFLAYDVLQRRLRDQGYETRCVRNVTDVDDDLLMRAREAGVHYLDLAAGVLTTFESDMQALGLLPAWSEPRATSAISDVRAFIGRVLASGHAYQADGQVWFDVTSIDRFGSLSGWDRPRMLAAALEHGGRPDDPAKRDPLDFVLWQRSAPGEPAWPARWGSGRPGWHVGCAALAVRELGTGIDLHGGGLDLVYPHHECEAAQAEAATGEVFVRHWMHTAMVQTGGVKMSKSAGNLTFVSDLLRSYEPAAVRLALVAHHYRTPWEWSEGLLDEAAERLERWRHVGPGDGALDVVRAALDDDLSTPDAIAALDAAAAQGEGVAAAASLLGVDVMARATTAAVPATGP